MVRRVKAAQSDLEAEEDYQEEPEEGDAEEEEYNFSHGMDAEEPSNDVRLQLHDGWILHFGSADYDCDHRGHWGASSFDSATDAEDVVWDLLDQALEHWSTDSEE